MWPWLGRGVRGGSIAALIAACGGGDLSVDGGHDACVGAGCELPAGDPVVASTGAAPWAHGAAVTITGTGFGSRGHAAPMVFDTLESGAFDPLWASTTELAVDATAPRHARSTYHALNDFDGAANHGQFQAPGDVRARWYVHHWIQFADDWDWGTSGYGEGDQYLANIKLFRLWNPGDIDEDLVVAYLGWEDAFTWQVDNVTGSPVGFDYGASAKLARGAWHAVEYEFAEASAPGTPDGVFRMWIDGATIFEHTAVPTREDFDVFKRPLIIGASAVWGPGDGEDPQAPNHLRIDDLWMDDAWARVALCPGATWATRGACELQPIVAWADGAIEVSGNLGRFEASDDVYLYVLRDDGTPSAAFGPIAIDAGG
ncbi:MAG: hypothetical protein R2939_10605 [Kofleriaceae bacterium]